MHLVKQLADPAAVAMRAAGIVVLFALPGLASATNGHVPEPETLALVGIGAVALAIARWRKRK